MKFQIGDIVEYKFIPDGARKEKLCYLIVGLHREDFYDVVSFQDGKLYVLESMHTDYYNKLTQND
jgi:hypothetical protein